MSKKKILTLPDPILREVSEPVNKVDKDIKNLMDKKELIKHKENSVI